MIARVRLGDVEVFSLVENRMHLDGGAMFGVIPKQLWTREQPCDGDNLIPLDLNLLLIKAHGKHFLVDTGCGDAATQKEQKIYGLCTPSRLDERLASCGVTPADIDYVLFSHLHFDHSGGGVRREASGRVVTRFANARYVVSRREWEDATSPNERTLAAYVPEYLEAYDRSGQVETTDGVTDIEPGITVRPTGGHTAGHQAIVIQAGGEAIGYYADIFPTRTHLRTAWVPAVDTHPLESLKVKKEILKACFEDDIWLAFDHDTQMKMARVEQQNGKYLAVPLPSDRVEVVTHE